ncbi:MAG: alpha/beta hydrolase [bacterium]
MKFLIAAIILLALFAFVIRFTESKFIYFPLKYPQGYWHPETFGLQPEDCYFTTPDGERLHGWYFAKDQAMATLLWCHGNAGNISDRLDNLDKLHQLPVNIFIFDYRGYGKSTGRPDEHGLYLDAEAAFDYLVSRPDMDAKTIVVFGRSLGGAVAVDLATRRACAAMILESTFTSAKDMARSAFGLLPVSWIIKTKLNAIDKISSVRVPLLVLHGIKDQTVPFRLGRRLFDAANEPKEFYPIPGADHNNTYAVGGQPYFDKLLTFIRDSVQQGNPKFDD